MVGDPIIIDWFIHIKNLVNLSISRTEIEKVIIQRVFDKVLFLMSFHTTNVVVHVDKRVGHYNLIIWARVI